MDFLHPRWPVFHEDNQVLVLYKPAGVITQRDAPGKVSLDELAKIWLKERYAKPGRVFVGLVHRLDAPVAGVMVLARTSKAAARMSAQFREGGTQKHYLAVVQGRPTREAGRLVHRLRRSGRYSQVGPEGQEAALAYRLLESSAAASLLEIVLETGRRHQIRAQLTAIGCPILGDRSYGAETSLPDGRIALLSHRLSFTHPTQGLSMSFESPLPEGWPWPCASGGPQKPLWTIEEFRRSGWVPPQPP